MMFESCPESPNCVSSLSQGSHYIEPIRVVGDSETAWAGFIQAILEEKRLQITTQDSRSLKAEVRSLVFRFVDDLKAWHDLDEDVIHIRSASRTGYSDFGVNRRRVERIRKRYSEYVAR